MAVGSHKTTTKSQLTSLTMLREKSLKTKVTNKVNCFPSEILSAEKRKHFEILSEI